MAQRRGRGVNSTHQVKRTTPAAADWTKPPQMALLLSDQRGAGMGAGFAHGNIMSNSIPLPVSCHCNPSGYTATSCPGRRCLDDTCRPITT